MPTSNVGLGIGLQSDLGAATRLWSQDYNRKANAIAANKRDKDLANQKQSDYINKYLNTANSGLHPMYQPEVKKQSVAYLQKIAANPDYARTNEGIQEFQNVITYVDKAQQATKNIGKTAEIVLGHPDDMTIDESINDVVSRGDLEGFKKLNGGNEFYELGLGTKGIMNLNEMNKFANQRAYGNPEPDPRVRKVGDLMIADEVVKANLANHKADALLYYESHPFAAKEWESKGGFEAAYKMLEQPTDKYKTIYTGQVQRGKSGDGTYGSKSGSVNVKQYTRQSDGATITEMKDNTSTNDPKLLHIPAGQITANGKVTEDPMTIQDPKVVELDGRLWIEGIEKVPEGKLKDSTELGIGEDGKPIIKVTKGTGKEGVNKVLEVQPNDKGLELLQKLANTFGDVTQYEIGEDGKWKPVGINDNLNLRNYDNKGLKQSKTTKAADVKMKKGGGTAKKPTYVTLKGEEVDMTGASDADIQKLMKLGKIKVK